MLTYDEQIILLDMLKNRPVKISFETQKIIKYDYTFSKIMSNLDKLEMINKVRVGNKTYFTLSDYGYLMALLLNKHYNTLDKYREIDKHTVHWFVD
jgi:hypothetical protein